MQGTDSSTQLVPTAWPRGLLACLPCLWSHVLFPAARIAVRSLAEDHMHAPRTPRAAMTSTHRQKITIRRRIPGDGTERASETSSAATPETGDQRLTLDDQNLFHKVAPVTYYSLLKRYRARSKHARSGNNSPPPFTTGSEEEPPQSEWPVQTVFPHREKRTAANPQTRTRPDRLRGPWPNQTGEGPRPKGKIFENPTPPGRDWGKRSESLALVISTPGGV